EPTLSHTITAPLVKLFNLYQQQHLVGWWRSSHRFYPAHIIGAHRIEPHTVHSHQPNPRRTISNSIASIIPPTQLSLHRHESPLGAAPPYIVGLTLAVNTFQLRARATS
ncbi:MAG TPA: hypothetical protein VIY29_15375, partial [Ktedonobacteraceae bacterium]